MEFAIEAIIKRNEELAIEAEQCPPGDTTTLLKIQRELGQNNKEILEWANNIGRDAE